MDRGRKGSTGHSGQGQKAGVFPTSLVASTSNPFPWVHLSFQPHASLCSASESARTAPHSPFLCSVKVAPAIGEPDAKNQQSKENERHQDSCHNAPHVHLRSFHARSV